MNFEDLKKMNSKSPEEVVKLLWAALKGEQSSKAADYPFLQMQFSSGSVLNGHLVHYDVATGSILIVQSIDQQYNLHYSSIYGVQSLSIRDAHQWLHVLSNGEIPYSPPSTRIHSSLELKSLFAAYIKEINELLGKELSIAFPETRETSDLFRYQVKAIIDLFHAVVSEILNDPMGKEAFGEKVNTIQLSHGEDSVSLSDQTLFVSVAMGQEKHPNISKAKLQNLIEELL